MSNQWLEHLIATNGCLEVRGLLKRSTGARRTESSWFNDATAAAEYCSWLQSEGLNVYSTINQPKAGVIGECRDLDIEAITGLFIDVDSKGSTQGEVRQQLERIIEYLAGFRFPADPIRAYSGDGFQAQYPLATALPADRMKPLMRDWYTVLAERFTGFDSKVFNPGRICRVYGYENVNHAKPLPTWVKWPDTLELLHRDALVALNDDVQAALNERREARQAEIEASRERFRASNQANPSRQWKDARTYDIVSWAKAEGLYIRHQRDH